MRPKRIQQKASYKLPALLNREIGRVIVGWAHLENHLQAVCYMLLRLKGEEGRVAVRQPRATDRLEMILDLLFLNRMQAHSGFFKSMQKRIGEAAEFRDLFAHGIWTYSEEHKKWAVQNTRGNWGDNQTGIRAAGKKRITPEGLLVSLDGARYVASQIDGLISDAKLMQIEIEAQLQERSE
jgi:hypothetical protein